MNTYFVPSTLPGVENTTMNKIPLEGNREDVVCQMVRSAEEEKIKVRRRVWDLEKVLV